MSANIRLGIFGLWRGGAFAVNAKNAGADIVAVCDSNESRFAGIRKYCTPDATFHTDFDDFIKQPMDGVVLCNYFHEHAAYAVKAMKKGIHVLSETISNATMADGAALCETAEKAGAIYMLAENYPFMKSNLELKRIYEEGALGRILYAEGEYVHPMDRATRNGYTPAVNHWRAWLPSCYYSTHALAPLMFMTGSIPKEVNARLIFAPEILKGTAARNADTSVIMLCTMEDGSVFRIIGWTTWGGHSLWYRLCCVKGTAETVRGDMEKVMINYNEWDKPENADIVKTYPTEWPSNAESAEKSAHGGGDFWVMHEFVKSVKEKKQPFFDVHRSTLMASAAILAWRSALNGGMRFDIPDLRIKAVRDRFANDTLSPFPDENGVSSMPCSSQPYEPTSEDLAAAVSDWNPDGKGK